MLTFTDDHKGEALDSWLTLGSRWNLVRTWLKSSNPDMQYVRVIEPHQKGGWPHMHVLINFKPSNSGIRALLKQWGWGYIYDQMSISAKGAADYVSKYLTKPWPGRLANMYRSQTKTRIVQASQSLGPIFSVKSTWTLISRDIESSEIEDYVWDKYKERFINHKNGANLISRSECFLIESFATKEDHVKLDKLSFLLPEISIEDSEILSPAMFGIQQSLLPLLL